MNSDEPRYSVGMVLHLMRGSTPACRVLALALALTCLAVTYAGMAWDVADPVQYAVASNPQLWQGETWRLVTAPWVHDGFTHLVFVLVNLLFFGPIVEDLMGTTRFILLALWGTAVALAASMAVPGLTPTCGASPLDMTVFGVLGVALTLRRQDFDPLVRAALALGLVLSVFLLGALPLLDVRVNAASHLGGLMAGIMVAPVLLPVPFDLPPGVRFVVPACMALMVTSLLGMALVPRPEEVSDYEQNLGLELYHQGREAEADQHLQKAWSLTQDQAALAYDVGYLADRRGDLDGAEQSFRQSVSIKPTFIEGWDALAEVALDREDTNKALAWLHQEERLRPGDASIALSKAKAYEMAGRLEEADSAIQSAVAMKGADVDARIAWGRLLAREGKLDQARAELDQALKATTNPVPVLQAMADVELDAGQAEAAGSDLQKALQVNDSDVSLLLAQAQWYEGHLQPADARRFYRAARKVDGDNVQVLLHLAHYYRDQGELYGARRCLELVLRQPMRDQGDIEVQAQARLWLRDLPAASRLAAEAVEHNPHDPQAQELEGVVHMAMGQTGAARSALREAATEAPLHPGAWFRLGVLAMGDDRPQAAACFDRYAALARLPRETTLAKGYLELVNGHAAAALVQAQSILQALPYDADALRLACGAAHGEQQSGFAARLKSLEP